MKNYKKILDILEMFKKVKISKDELELTKKAIMDIEISSEESCIGEFYGEQVILRQILRSTVIFKRCIRNVMRIYYLDYRKEIFVMSKMKIVLSVR